MIEFARIPGRSCRCATEVGSARLVAITGSGRGGGCRGPSPWM